VLTALIFISGHWEQYSSHMIDRNRMLKFAPLLVALALASACAAPMTSDVNVNPIPGRISQQREMRDQETCQRLDKAVDRNSGFLFEIAQDCDTALNQILNTRTSLASFDVARAYLDALHDYANALDFLSAQGHAEKKSSDFGAYLIGQQTGLIGAMHDWRIHHGMQKYPVLYKPVDQVMV
jgi:hypothetical protein